MTSATSSHKLFVPNRPDDFYAVYFADDFGFYPANDLYGFDEEWDLAKCLEFVMGAPPVCIHLVRGYGKYLEHEDFWVVGRTPEELQEIFAEWPEGD